VKFRLRNTSKGALENPRVQFLEGPDKIEDVGDCASVINTEYSKDSNGAANRGTRRGSSTATETG